MIIKNYKELCRLIEVEPRNGTNSINSHIKEISQYIKFDRNGRKFIVVEIYDIPIPINDGRDKFLPLVK